jgi:hypothetical protein
MILFNDFLCSLLLRWNNFICLFSFASFLFYLFQADIQIIQLGQYGTESSNTFFFLVLADVDPDNIGVPDIILINLTYCLTCFYSFVSKSPKFNKFTTITGLSYFSLNNDFVKSSGRKCSVIFRYKSNRHIWHTGDDKK